MNEQAPIALENAPEQANNLQLAAEQLPVGMQPAEEMVASVEAQPILPADMPLVLLEPIEPQLPIGNGIIPAPIEAPAPIAAGGEPQPQQAVWVDPRLVAEISAILDHDNIESEEVKKLKCFDF